MSDESGEGLDRRDFMVAAVGASAALAANSAAQGADQANTASRGTVYTGDMIDRKKVISALNIDDLEPGSTSSIFKGCRWSPGNIGTCP